MEPNDFHKILFLLLVIEMILKYQPFSL